MEDCRRELVMDATETDDMALIGDECHIVARKPDGPRGESDLPAESRDKYDNFILLCRVHHKIIDDQPRKYTVDILQRIKAAHERWIKESLEGYDAARQRDDEIYATYAEKWAELAGIDDWKAWSSHVLDSGHPCLWLDVDKKLDELKEWLFSRIWPRRYSGLENAFENFRRVLQNFHNVFHEHAEQSGDILFTKKFYKIDEWNEELYERLGRMYEFHVDLVQDLMMELTRAANYVCDKIREFIDLSFRLNQGALIVESGPYMDLSWRQHRAEYRGDERTNFPYPGIEEFKRIRKTRDYAFGVGVSTEDPEFLEWYRKRD